MNCWSTKDDTFVYQLEHKGKTYWYVSNQGLQVNIQSDLTHETGSTEGQEEAERATHETGSTDGQEEAKTATHENGST